jgi:uncharacterized protein
MPLFADAILIDASAAVALANEGDQFHSTATEYFKATEGILWVVLNVTTHEAYTRVRYDVGFEIAKLSYDFLRSDPIYQLDFTNEDEKKARSLLEKYQEHSISFHDALCATVMNRFGVYKAFTFDHHFYCFGFEVLPGYVR